LTPTEFVLWFVYLPWGIALICLLAFVLLIVLGGETLRTLVMGRLDKRTHYAMAFSDGGGGAVLKRYHFDGTHGILENDKEFLPFTTPLSDREYTPRLLVPTKEATPEQVDAINEENQKRLAEANRLNAEMPLINEVAKKRSTFEGRPLWLVHMGKNVAETPALIHAQEKAAQMRRAPQITPVELLSVDIIKDFLSANFSRDRLWSLVQKGRDIEAYGRPKKPLNPLLIIILVVGFLFIGLGIYILMGGFDFSGFLKGLGVMR